MFTLKILHACDIIPNLFEFFSFAYFLTTEETVYMLFSIAPECMYYYIVCNSLLIIYISYIDTVAGYRTTWLKDVLATDIALRGAVL